SRPSAQGAGQGALSGRVASPARTHAAARIKGGGLMKRVTWTLAPVLALVWAGESRGQFLPSYSSGGYAQGGGIGFSYQRRHLSLFGSFGGLSGGRLGMG